jgi:3-oxoacyl-[acyl-carrier protein] reductase
VVVNYLKNQSLAEAVVTEIESMGGQGAAIGADVRNADQVNEMMGQIMDQFGGMDVVVNNALCHYTFNPNSARGRFSCFFP